jgi:thiol-disulfide isomerase/thioredoxin
VRSPLLLVVALALGVSALPSIADDEAPTLDDIRAALGDPSALDGHVVYVDFWASWCVPCRTSFPWMQKMLAAHAEEGLRIVTVNVDRKPEAARRFIQELGTDLPVIDDPEGTLAKRFGLEAMPTAFVFDRIGQLELRHEGFRQDDAEALERALAELLAERYEAPGDGATAPPAKEGTP